MQPRVPCWSHPLFIKKKSNPARSLGPRCLRHPHHPRSLSRALQAGQARLRSLLLRLPPHHLTRPPGQNRTDPRHLRAHERPGRRDSKAIAFALPPAKSFVSLCANLFANTKFNFQKSFFCNYFFLIRKYVLIFPDFVTAYPKIRLKREGRFSYVFA